MIDGIQLGAHTSTAGGVQNAIEEGQRLGCDVVQVFTRNQRRWHVGPLAGESVAAWRAAIERSGVRPAMSHCSYLVNLCATNPETLDKSRVTMLDELDRADALGIEFVVFHPGSHLGAGERAGLDAIAASLDRICAERASGGSLLCLENTAGQGSNLGHTFEQLAAIVDRVDDPDRLGVCLDTCHAFAAGYDLRDAARWRALLDTVDATVGLPRLRCLHLNDSKHALGSRRDRHERIGRGELGRDAFAAIVNDPLMVGRPMALETPVDDDWGYDDELAVLRSL